MEGNFVLYRMQVMCIYAGRGCEMTLLGGRFNTGDSAQDIV